MNAAVTGATGFVGRHLVNELIHAGTDVTAIVRPTSNTSRLSCPRIAIAPLDDRAALARSFARSEVVFHLAGAVDFGNDLERFRRVNVIGTGNVLHAALAAGVRRVVHCSSVVAIGASRSPVRLDESAKWNLDGLRVPYVTTKRDAECLALEGNCTGLEVVVANPTCVIGPGDFDGSEFGTMCQRFWRGRLPIHFGGGNNFVDVRDVARGLRLCSERGRAGERYILGGSNRSMTAFFSELGRATGKSIPRFRLPGVVAPLVGLIKERKSRQRQSRDYLNSLQVRLLPYFFYCDTAKARRELGFTTRSLTETLADTFAEYQHDRKAA